MLNSGKQCPYCNGNMSNRRLAGVYGTHGVSRQPSNTNKGNRVPPMQLSTTKTTSLGIGRKVNHATIPSLVPINAIVPTDVVVAPMLSKAKTTPHGNEGKMNHAPIPSLFPTNANANATAAKPSKLSAWLTDWINKSDVNLSSGSIQNSQQNQPNAMDKSSTTNEPKSGSIGMVEIPENASTVVDNSQQLTQACTMNQIAAEANASDKSSVENGLMNETSAIANDVENELVWSDSDSIDDEVHELSKQMVAAAVVTGNPSMSADSGNVPQSKRSKKVGAQSIGSANVVKRPCSKPINVDRNVRLRLSPEMKDAGTKQKRISSRIPMPVPRFNPGSVQCCVCKKTFYQDVSIIHNAVNVICSFDCFKRQSN